MRLSLAVAVIASACSNNGRPPMTRPDEAASVMRGIVAHRGASMEAPENTLASLRRGWEIGAESCEIDVRITADGKVVVIHDDTTRRTTNGAADLVVSEASLLQLRRLDVGSWKGAQYEGERIPTLTEALDATPPGRMLFVEIKSDGQFEDSDADTIADAIKAADPRPRGAVVALQSYDPRALAAVAQRLPGVESYWDVDPPEDDDGRPLPYPADLARTAADRHFTGLALDQRGVDDAFVSAMAAAGLVLDVWTVNDAAAIAAWRARGARWIETDHPALGRLVHLGEEAKKP